MRRIPTFLCGIACLACASCSEQGTTPQRTATPVPPAALIADDAPEAILPTNAEPAPVVAPKPHPDELQSGQVVGTWKQSETGVRWLRVRPDGTATMFIDPDWIAKAVIGSSLTIEIEWTIADGRVRMKSISGEPATAFKAVSALYGSDRDRVIARLDDEQFVMLDDSDGSKSEWSRVSPNEPLPKPIAN